MKKNIGTILVSLMAFAVQANADSLKDCRLYVQGKHVKEVRSFDIHNFSSETPEATVDGGLFDYSKTDKDVKMSFSNECDNMYEITFSNAALAKAKSGAYKTIMGKAVIATAESEKTFAGVLKCTVIN